MQETTPAVIRMMVVGVQTEEGGMFLAMELGKGRDELLEYIVRSLLLLHSKLAAPS